ncbi:RNA polymerase factor sigma-54 [Uruburuella testudinis]|uniref:RNA polymerase sigma-54 factor n=1 Tax=Uruburuella testudinis TaxID=1282863 RepID=A0ABY4DXM6_9NEIS|nr:RNA polymerase factor sigma-54 [Uruburuella testudinis]UOO82362.1 RNA polymerase factor sigma-54 [Uruburuella testudinis]
MSQTFQLKLKQTQQLNQSLQQSLRILQMSGLELEQEVEEWLQDNPLLERPDSEEEGSGPQLSADIGKANRLSGEDAEDIWATLAEEDDFNAFLHKQVCEHPLSDSEAARVHILIDFLDEQGYLTDSFSDIIDHTPLEWMLEEDSLQEALDQLHTFDPPGVGAADLRESLLLQLQRLPASPPRNCAARIVNLFLDQLGKSRQQNIGKFKKALPQDSTETIQTALDLIAGLNPYPAYGFVSAEPTAYVQPDVWVREGKEGWVVSGNESAWPKIRLNREYCTMLEAAEGVDKVWKEKLIEARQKIDSLAHRKSTVLRLAEYIVERQEDFFVFGEIGLSPMLLKDAAAELGVAESTVSRAVNHKYLSCPRGVFALRYFFTQAVATEDGEGASQSAVKAVMAQLVAAENKQKPYSDEALSKLLKQQGIDIARRTVAKYREALHIPPAHQRKP